MALSYSAFFRYIDTATGTNPKVPASPEDVPAGAFIVVPILNRTNDSATVVSISDPVNGAWDVSQWSLGNPTGTLISGPLGNAIGPSFRTYVYGRSNSAALTGGANRIATVTFSTGISVQIPIGWIRESAGTLRVDNVGTTLVQTTAQGTWNTNPFAIGGAGVAVGFLAVATSQGAVAPTMVGSGETLRTTLADAGSFRANIITEVIPSAGNYGFETTINSASGGNYHQFSLTTSSAPSLTSINGGSVISIESTGNLAAGTNFDLDDFELEQDWGAIAIPYSSADADSFVFDINTEGGGVQPRIGAGTARVRNNGGATGTLAVTFAFESANYGYVNVGTPNANHDLWMVDFDADPVVDDQVQWFVDQSGYDGTSVNINSDLTGDWADGLNGFWRRLHADSDGTYGAWVFQPIGAADEFVAFSFIAGTAQDEDGRIGTIFLGQDEPVPIGAIKIAGIAHSEAGRRYVCAWPTSGIVYRLGKVALRSDGAMCIVSAASPRYMRAAWSLSDRGEVLATTDLPQRVVDGYGMRDNGYLCMTEVAPI